METEILEEKDEPGGNRKNKNSWKWQFSNRITSLKQLLEYFPHLKLSQEIEKVFDIFPISITPYYASLIKEIDYNDPIFAMSIPSIQELYNPDFLNKDPLDEDGHMPVPRLVHRYPDRVLVIATQICSMNCRFCTRKREVGKNKRRTINNLELENIYKYILNNKSIKDVIVSGGDPLTMPTAALERVIKRLRSVPHVDIIRIGTKVPVVLPQRIDKKLLNMLKKYHPIYINTHFNHPNEVTIESSRACEQIADAGIPLGNQSVLLKGVNDNKIVLETLFRNLLKIRCKPYYLFNCDKILGTYHFHTKIEKGIEIMSHLRGKLSGLAIPSFIVDLPEGGGKIPLLPNYIESIQDNKIIFRNLFEGKTEYFDEKI